MRNGTSRYVKKLTASEHRRGQMAVIHKPCAERLTVLNGAVASTQAVEKLDDFSSGTL